MNIRKQAHQSSLEAEEALNTLLTGVQPLDVSVISYPSLSRAEWADLPYIDTGLVSLDDRDVLDDLAAQESLGPQIRLHAHLAALSVLPGFETCLPIRVLATICKNAALFQKSEHPFSHPFITRRYGSGVNAETRSRLYATRDDDSLMLLYPHSGVYSQVILSLHLAFYLLTKACKMTPVVERLYLETLVTPRSKMKRIKTTAQLAVATTMSPDVPHFAWHLAKYAPGSSSVPTRMYAESPSQFAKLVNSNYTKFLRNVAKEDFPDYKLSGDPVELGLVESFLELTGMRRGPITQAVANVNLANLKGPDPLLFEAQDIATHLYSTLLKTGAEHYHVSSVSDWIRKNLTTSEIISSIRSMKSAGMGQMPFKYVVSGDSVVVARLDDDRPGTTNQARYSTKKGAHAILQMRELRELMSDPHLFDALTFAAPGSVGSRFVAYKDPRLIFIVPLVLHLILNSVTRLINFAVRRRDDIFIYSEKGDALHDVSALTVATCDSDQRAVANSADWASWDATLPASKLAGICNALRDVFPDDPTGVEMLIACMRRTHSGVYRHATRSEEICVTCARLASGSPLTSIRGSVDNLAQVHALLKAYLREHHASLGPETLVPYAHTFYLRENGSRIRFRLEGVCTMGDDVSLVVSYPKGTSDELAAASYVNFCAWLSDNAWRVWGEMNPSKQLVGPHLAVFVRKMRFAGVAVPRFSVSPFVTENCRLGTITSHFSRLVSRASEWSVRGCDPQLVNRWLIALWDVAGYETLSQAPPGLESYPRGDRHQVFLPRAQLFAPSSSGGCGMCPFGPITNSSSMVCDVLFWAFRNNVKIFIDKTPLSWDDEFGFFKSANERILKLLVDNPDVDIGGSFPEVRDNWKQALLDSFDSGFNEARRTAIMAGIPPKVLADRAGDRIVDAVVASVARADAKTRFSRPEWVEIKTKNWKALFPSDVTLPRAPTRMNATYIARLYQYLRRDIRSYLSHYGAQGGSSPLQASFQIRRFFLSNGGTAEQAECFWNRVVPLLRKSHQIRANLDAIFQAMTGRGGVDTSFIANCIDNFDLSGMDDEFSFRDSLSMILGAGESPTDTIKRVLGMHMLNIPSV